MGLDMYLEKRTYIGNNYKPITKQTKIRIEGIKQKRVTYIIEAIGYWRKENAIHNWFVKNIQNSNDDCKEYYVEHEKLEELLEIINKILENNLLAHELLPTQEGFFFGKTEYDEYYFKGLEYTKKIIEGLLEEEEKETNKCHEYYYQSSW